jgi:hypothetical protein
MIYAETIRICEVTDEIEGRNETGHVPKRAGGTWLLSHAEIMALAKTFSPRSWALRKLPK